MKLRFEDLYYGILYTILIYSSVDYAMGVRAYQHKVEARIEKLKKDQEYLEKVSSELKKQTREVIVK